MLRMICYNVHAPGKDIRAHRFELGHAAKRVAAGIMSSEGHPELLQLRTMVTGR